MARTTKVKKRPLANPVPDDTLPQSDKNRFTAEMRVIVTRNKPKVWIDELEEEVPAFPYDPPVYH